MRIVTRSSLLKSLDTYELSISQDDNQFIIAEGFH